MIIIPIQLLSMATIMYSFLFWDFLMTGLPCLYLGDTLLKVGVIACGSIPVILWLRFSICSFDSEDASTRKTDQTTQGVVDGGRGGATSPSGKLMKAEDALRLENELGSPAMETRIALLVETLIGQSRFSDALDVAYRANEQTRKSRCKVAFRHGLDSSCAKARKALLAGEFRDALSMYCNALSAEKALLTIAESGTPRANLRMGRAVCHSILGNLQKAFEDYCDAVKLAPASVAARKGFAECLVEMGHLQGALEAYERVLQLDTEDEEVIAKIDKLRGLIHGKVSSA